VPSLQGTIRLQKRLDFSPSVMCTYPRPRADAGALDALLIGTHASHLVVMKEMTLAWAARAMSPPIALAVAKFGAYAGMICSLDATGGLAVQARRGRRCRSSALALGCCLDFDRADIDGRGAAAGVT
jgi:hypothetical protein